MADRGESPLLKLAESSKSRELFEQLFKRQGIADHFVRLDCDTHVGINVTDPVIKEKETLVSLARNRGTTA
jgi:hypothetical protein